MDTEKRAAAGEFILAMDGIRVFNEIGAVLTAYYEQKETCTDFGALAARLENWFYYYKKLWRSVSRESGLSQIEAVIIWYADLLRSL